MTRRTILIFSKTFLLVIAVFLYSCAEENRYCIEGDCENGTGVLEKRFDDGGFIRYTGEFKDGKILKGRMEYSTGSWYEGNFINKTIYGQGKSFSEDSSFYEGGFESSSRHGYGILKSKDGSIYEGAFDYDYRTGKGKLTYANGDVYEGDFHNNLFYGQGTFVWTNAKVSYSGGWKNGLKAGQGKVTLANGDIQEGVWDADTLVTQTAYITNERTAPIVKEQTASAEKVYKFSKRKNIYYHTGISREEKDENLSGTITINEQQGIIILAYDEQGNSIWRYAIKSKKQVNGWMCYYGEIFVEQGWIRKYVLKYNLSKSDGQFHDDRFHIIEYVRDKFNIETDGYDSFRNIQMQLFFSGEMMN